MNTRARSKELKELNRIQEYLNQSDAFSDSNRSSNSSSISGNNNPTVMPFLEDNTSHNLGSNETNGSGHGLGSNSSSSSSSSSGDATSTSNVRNRTLENDVVGRSSSSKGRAVPSSVDTTKVESVPFCRIQDVSLEVLADPEVIEKNIDLSRKYINGIILRVISPQKDSNNAKIYQRNRNGR